MTVPQRAAVALLLLSSLGAAPLLHRKPKQVLVLDGVRLIDGTSQPPFDNVSILIRDGNVRQIAIDKKSVRWPQDAEVINLSGKTVMPSLIAAHSHLGLTSGATVSSANYTEENVARQLQQFERYGVTTVLSLGMNKDALYDFRSDQMKGKLDGATILTADRGIGVPGGVPPVAVDADQVYRPASPGEARDAVRQMAKRDPALIKLWIDDNLRKLPPPNPAVYEAAIDEAHQRNLKVAAHVYYLADAKKLLAAHVDILAHSVRDQEIDDVTVETMKRQNVYYIPTLQLEDAFFIYADHPKWMNTPFFQNALNPDLSAMFDSKAWVDKIEQDPATQIHRTALETAMKNLSKLVQADVLIGFGTDSGANPFRIPGFAEHRELQLMVQAGMTPLQAIQSATLVNARMLGILKTAGTVELNKSADLLVLDADPTVDIRNTQKIAMVFHHGQQKAHDKSPASR